MSWYVFLHKHSHVLLCTILTCIYNLYPWLKKSFLELQRLVFILFSYFGFQEEENYNYILDLLWLLMFVTFPQIF